MRALPLSTRDVLPYVTIHAAASLGLDHQIGSITPGKQADLVLIATEDLSLLACEPTAALVQAAHPGNVHTVLVAGRVVKRRRMLVGVHLSGLRQEVHTANRRTLYETSHHAITLASSTNVDKSVSRPPLGAWRADPALREPVGG